MRKKNAHKIAISLQNPHCIDYKKVYNAYKLWTFRFLSVIYLKFLGRRVTVYYSGFSLMTTSWYTFDTKWILSYEFLLSVFHFFNVASSLYTHTHFHPPSASFADRLERFSYSPFTLQKMPGKIEGKKGSKKKEVQPKKVSCHLHLWSFICFIVSKLYPKTL